MAYGVVNADLMTTSDGVSSSGLYGFKNRLINSAMVIDQRNAGASVTPTTGQYLVDRWQARLSQASKFTVQQNAGSLSGTNLPSGFTNYLGATVGASANVTVGATDFFFLQQRIEGYNVADLNWGNANAKTVTLSFWVRSSLTGTFGGSLFNDNADRSYPFTYTISSANTWTQASVTIAGDTSGTWLTTNGNGLSVNFSLGSGTSVSGTAGSWAGATYYSATSAVKLIETNSATFYITGVQLEKGSTATSFDYRPYGTELQLCQRYYEIIGGSFGGNAYSTTYFMGASGFRATKRATPTLALLTTTPQMYQAGLGLVTGSGSANAASNANVDGFYMAVGGFSGLTQGIGCGMQTASVFSASSEL